MSEHNLITSYNEQHSTITTYIEPLEQQAIYPQWNTISSKRSISAIAIAPRSRRIWMATSGGIIAKDTQKDLSYRRYGSEHGLCGNSVACICIDNEEHPWTGHIEGSLSYFTGQHWQTYPYLQSQLVRALCTSQHLGGIWVALNEMVYRINAYSAMPIPVTSVGHPAVLEALAILDTGKYLLVGNAFGLYALNEGQEPIQIAPEHITSCTALVQDRDGRIWIGTREGIFVGNGDKDISGPLHSEDREMQHILSIAASYDKLWVLTTHGIVTLFHETWSEPISLPESTPDIYTLVAHPEELGVWVGTDQMLAHLDLQQSASPHWQDNWLPLQPEDQLHNLGHCILPQKYRERVWIGTAGELISCEGVDKWVVSARYGDVRALSITQTKSGKALWGITWPGGIGEWHGQDWIDFHKNQPVGLPTALTTGQDGYLYGLVGPALYRFTYAEAQKIANAPAIAARSLKQTPDGQWWIGTVRGIYRLSKGIWEFVGEQPGPLQSAVRALEVIGEDLLAATESGLWRFHHTKWELLTTEQAEPLCDVQALASSTALTGLWLARASGLVLYEPYTRRQLLHYTTINSGLASNRINAVAEIEEIVWLTTYAGISCLRLTETEHEIVKGAMHECSTT
jgi:ligand-binding sensor domain-containing protein